MLEAKSAQCAYFESFFASCSEEFRTWTHYALVELPTMGTRDNDHIGANSGLEKPGNRVRRLPPSSIGLNSTYSLNASTSSKRAWSGSNFDINGVSHCIRLENFFWAAIVQELWLGRSVIKLL